MTDTEITPHEDVTPDTTKTFEHHDFYVGLYLEHGTWYANCDVYLDPRDCYQDAADRAEDARVLKVTLPIPVEEIE